MSDSKDSTGMPIPQTEAQWKAALTPDQYRIMREHGTEPAFTGKYDDFYEAGTYACAGCGQPLFTSLSKFHSGSGWPSFYQPIETDALETEQDSSWGMRRTEFHCSNCGSHLGHVFEDGPQPTGLRYCTNSACLQFIPAED